MSLQQAQQEGLCLRYPENLGLHPSLTYEHAVNLLLRAISSSQQVPFSWAYIDKPPEGQLYLLFLTIPNTFPLDGIQYQEQETRFLIPVGNNRELEISEIKFGFIPNSQDTAAWRGRRRYRLHKGGHQQLVLVHYFRGPFSPIHPKLLNQPVRSYPLRQVNEPPIYVMGDKMGQKAFPQHGGQNAMPPITSSTATPTSSNTNTGIGAPQPPQPPPPPQGPPHQSVVGPPPHHPHPHPQGMHPHPHAAGMTPLPMNIHTQHAMLAQQNSTMEALERRRERERAAARERGAAAAAAMRAQAPRIEEDDSADEADHISTRTLAMTRYKRNHELMNHIFYHAAFGHPTSPKQDQPPTAYAIFNQAELEQKAVKLSADIDQLKKRAFERAQVAIPSDTQVADMAMMDIILDNGITVL